ncbi:MAG: fibronectin type III domain-containing protein [Gemmatimonadota bacterium]
MSKRNLLATLTVIGVAMFGLAACDDDNGNGTGPTVPSAPTGLDYSVGGDGTSVTVTWTAGSGADSYEVVVDAPDEDPRTETVDGSESSATITGLTRGVTYTAQVTAINDAGEATSSAINFTIPAEEPSFVRITGDIEEDMTFTSDKFWILDGPVFVGRDVGPDGTAADGKSVTLTIEPGTTILGDPQPPQGTRSSYLTVSRGSKIIADANANRTDESARPNPEDVIVMTSLNPPGQRARGDWGGLIVNGRGQLNTGVEASGEGDSGFYGGDDDDSSGILRGVRVEFAGDNITTTDQLNGIAFQGTGSGTIVDYVQVHYNTDDGTEPFGGAVTQTHMVMSGIGDDSFDGTDGWRGFMQFGLAQQRNDDADNGFEFSTGGDNDQGTPKSMAVVANVTLVGAGQDLGTGEINIGAESDHGILMREGTNFRLFNIIATGFGGGGESGFCVEDSQSKANADTRLGGSDDPNETLRVENSVVWSNGDIGGGDHNFCDASGDGGYTVAENKAFWEDAAFGNVIADPNLPDEAFSIGSQSSPPNFVPTAAPSGYTAFDASSLNGATGLVMPSGDNTATLQDAAYAGALEPGTALEDAWYYGWTVWTVDGSDSRDIPDDL